MSAKGCHTIAEVKGTESYETLRDSFGEVFKDINESIKKKKLCINGKELTLENFLGGDYKFILILIGM
jgi:hypothetical protein